MQAKPQEARELIRALIGEGLVGNQLGKTIKRGGEQVRISRDGEGVMRFDLDDMERAFVLKSNRLYERPYQPPEQIDHMQKQLNYRGVVEEVDTHLYSNRVDCACGSVRWVKNADLFQVKRCNA